MNKYPEMPSEKWDKKKAKMKIKLSEIEGLVPEKKPLKNGPIIEVDEEGNSYDTGELYDSSYHSGYNVAISEISSRELSVGMDRNKIIEIIESWESYKDGIKNVSPEHFYTMNAVGLADSIIKSSQTIIKVEVIR